MTQIAVSPTQDANYDLPSVEVKTDSMASGLSFMIVANVLQRAIGFVRNVSFCHFLSEQHLGLWAIASSFFLIAAPLSGLGLPGSLARFVDLYRRRGQLSIYLKRIILGSTISASILVAAMVYDTKWTGSVLFGEPQPLATLLLVCGTLICIVTFNFLTELLSGLRQAKSVSMMQVVNSLAFTALSVVALSISSDWRGVLMAFGLASLIGAVPGIYVLCSKCKNAFAYHSPLPATEMWKRVLPFAATIWLMNMLTNLFDVLDRYMLLYLSSDDIHVGQAIVGQYHSGRILPVLLTSLALMINGMVLPYLSADWEAGRKEAVRNTLQFIFKITIMFFWFISIGSMIIAPWLFNHILGGRYSDGLSIMPIALIHCTIAAATLLLQNYFWCVEKGTVISTFLCIGLAVNATLNFQLVPMYGVVGAMTATAFSSHLILFLTLIRLDREKFGFAWSICFIALLPLTLLISTEFSAAIFVGLVLLIQRTDWIFNEQEKLSIFNQARPITMAIERISQRFSK